MRFIACFALVCAIASVGHAFFHVPLPISSFVAPTSFSATSSQLRLRQPMNLCMGDSMLDGILERKRKEVEELKANPPEGATALLEGKKIKGGKFAKAVKKPKGTVSVVPQIKAQTPAGSYNLNNMDPVIMSAHCYEAGAHAMAVCVDKDAYGLDYDDLKRAVKQQACYKGNFPSPLPIMAFDFFVDPIQLAVAADAGANAVNLNMKILDDSLPDMLKTCDQLGLDAVVQVHNSEELKAACEAGAKIVGVTNRDYDTWGRKDEVDGIERLWFKPVEETVFGLISEVPDGVIAMAMGGVNETLMAWTLRDAGYVSVMVGEQAMLGSQSQQSQTSYSAGFNEMKGIIMAFRSKGSKKYGPTATASFYGKGEGAKEELGMISI